MLEKNGHGDTLAAGRIPDELVEWRVALARRTASMRNERDMVRAIVDTEPRRLSDAVVGRTESPAALEEHAASCGTTHGSSP